ncbi:MAG: flagellar hook protein FlgE [Nitrospirota bacterium]
MGILSALFAAVSGLNANGTNLSIIGNNIANTGTVGFKSSRANFADIVNSSLGGASGATSSGIGVFLSGIQSNFTQGSLQTTNNALDLAVDGNGFFQVKDTSGGAFYTRAGQFNVNKDGDVVNPDGLALQGFQADALGNITGSIAGINLSTTTSPPNATTSIEVSANLNSQSLRIGVGGKLVSGGATTPPTTAAGNNSFDINLNGDGVKTVTVANALTGAPLASAIQTAVRALAATDPFKAAAYTGFTAAYDAGTQVYTFTSGMTGVANTTGSTGTVVVTINGADTLATQLKLTAATSAVSTTGTDFDINDPAGESNFSTALTVYDSLGIGHIFNTYFTKVGTNTWNYNQLMDAADVTVNAGFASSTDALVASGTITFTTNGALDRESAILYHNAGGNGIDFIGATAGQAIATDFGTSVTGEGGTGLDMTTQFGSLSALVNQSQDGYASGSLQGLSVSTDGTVTGRFSNGQLRTLAQVALARFNNSQGLSKVGKNLVAEAGASGSPIIGRPDSSGLGRTLSNSLELSNVDLGEEFINLIGAERGFQANARVVSTADNILGELVNLKR